MPRLARLVVPGIPHHVTQRGNRKEPIFFSDSDYRFYLSLLRHGCRSTGTRGLGLVPDAQPCPPHPRPGP